MRASQHGERASVRALTNALVDAAKTLNLYRPYETLKDFGSIKSRRSGESEVIASPENSYLLKVKDPAAKEAIKQTSPRDWFYEHIIHNILFPDAAYEFIGITEEVGELKIILRQQEIPSERFPTDAQIAAHLGALGLQSEDRYFFGNELFAVTDVSSTSDNVLLDDAGNLRFIDPLIRLKRPALEIINTLIEAAP